MFESFDTRQTLSKKDFKALEPGLRAALVDAQFELVQGADFPVLILLSGFDALSRAACAKQLMTWLDSRHMRPFAIMHDEEAARIYPPMWRYWQALPTKGNIGLFLSTWYDDSIRGALLKSDAGFDLDRRLDKIVRFEDMLANEGALILKFLLVEGREEQLEDLKVTKASKHEPWKITEADKRLRTAARKDYDAVLDLAKTIVGVTHKGYAPWVPIASTNEEHRDMAVGKSLLAALKSRLERPAAPERPPAAPFVSTVKDGNVLDTLDLTQTLERDAYKDALKAQRRKLTRLTTGKAIEERSLIEAFEGNDAAGKGGAIRRVVQGLDPRLSRVVPVSKPTAEEDAHPYLWRFWRHIPRRGHTTLFDRSWYGRVLVERVEGFAKSHEWQRAYDEICAFEQDLTGAGAIVVKVWLAINKDEQLARFQDRENTPHKRLKITDEDWRNRDKWDDYRTAVHDMVTRTSTPCCPWSLIPANDKRFARVAVLKTINDRIEAALAD